MKILLDNYILLTELNYSSTQNYVKWKKEFLVIRFKLD